MEKTLFEQQLINLQEAINTLHQGNHAVLLDASITNILPAAVILLSESNNFQAVDLLFAQIISASQSDDKKLNQSATKCFIELVKTLAVTKHNYKEPLRKILPGLKAIADNPLCSDEKRADANSLLSDLEFLQDVVQEPVTNQQQKTKDPLTSKEDQIFQLSSAGEKEVAKKQLFNLVVYCAKKKDFLNAERLRERIYEIDPMALKEIIQSGEIIEHEKHQSISEDRLNIWSKLRENLGEKEFNDINYAMEEHKFKTEDIIVTQGANNDGLYFIESGSVRVSHLSGERELFVKNLFPGDIAGENFFNASIWTVSLTALNPSRILILKRDKLAELEQNKPGITSKLVQYYKSTADIHTMLKKKGMERRGYVRLKLTCPIKVQVIDNNRVISNFRGEVLDISVRGISFIVRITKKKNSRLLLGRNIRFSIPIREMQDTVPHGGTVIAIQPYDLISFDYSVHVKFDKHFESRAIQNIIAEYSMQSK